MSILTRAFARASAHDENVLATPHFEAASCPPIADAPPAEDDATFASLGISSDLVQALEASGIARPFPVQTLTIPDVLAGLDVCGKAKTGSGKTLAFGLPLIERTERGSARRRPRSLVLVPTRELANQIADALAPLAATRSLWLTAVYGGVSMLRQIQALHAGVDIVIATPGRLNDLLERGELSLDDVRFVVIDEADQMADMGFLPQVERILSHIEVKPQTLLFSATLDGAIGELVRKYQHEPARHEVASDSVSVDTLTQRFIRTTSEEKLATVARICAGAHRALVFVRTTHGADRLVRQLEREGLDAAAIHGRLAQSRRERTLAAFADGTAPVLVATNVAARGLHVDGVDVVVHYDPPEDGKTYLHRSGRTARAGEDGLVVTLVLPEQQRDVATLQREAGIHLAVVPMNADDPRLLDLAAWEPPAAPALEEARPQRTPPRGAQRANQGNASGRGRRRGYGNNRTTSAQPAPAASGRPANRRGSAR
ncbi:MAG: DEAD/DEAH box helicase [Dehalococcoidia bacterium]|nr:DEAD/DEAH box helicase [Dehalococcoidia bacterium]